MTFKEVQDLIRLVTKTKLTEFKMEEGEFKISIRTENYQKASSAPPTVVSMPAPAMAPLAAAPQAAPAPAAPAPAPAASSDKAPEEKKNYLEVRSPMVGTFYRSAGPGKPAFVQVGDQVKNGQVVCIVEAMKLFNEIESEVSGKIVKVMVEDAQPVEYDQVLFLVEG